MTNTRSILQELAHLGFVCFSREVLLATAFLTMVHWKDEVRGETGYVSLPRAYSDFAMNPETGDIAAVSVDASTATLLGREFLNGRQEVIGPQSVGKNPCSITFKRFQDKHYFAVLCAHEPNLYLLDSSKLLLVKKIPITGEGFTQIACSQNPADPFVYYCYGRGFDASIGVVDLRGLVDRGHILRDCRQCALSANGKMLYRRASSLSSLRLNGDFAADRPIFVGEFSDHKDGALFVPDPWDQYTSVGPFIFSRDLSQQVAKLDFPPECFSRKQPIVLGLDGTDAPRDREAVTEEMLFKNSQPRKAPSKVNLQVRVASYNTWESLGTADVSFSAKEPSDENAENRFRRNGRREGDQIQSRMRLFVDDAHDEAILAAGSQVAIIPLKDLKLSDEPFLQVRVSGEDNLIVGQKSEIGVQKFDARAGLSWEGLPEGARATARGIEWNPTGDQVGFSEVVALLKHGELERRQAVQLHVSYPHLVLPFPAQRIEMDSTGKIAICWWVPTSRDARQGSETHLALVDMAALKILAQKKFPFVIGAAAITTEFLFLADQDSVAVQVLKTGSLERVRTLQGDAPVRSISIWGGKTATLAGEGGSFVVSLPNLERVAAARPREDDRYPGLGDVLVVDFGGPIIEGVLYDETAKTPRLILAPQGFTGVEGFSYGYFPFASEHFREEGFRDSRFKNRNLTYSRGGYGSMTGQVRLPGSPVHLVLEAKTNRARGDESREETVELSLTLHDQVSRQKRQRLLLASTRPAAGQPSELFGYCAAGKTLAAVLNSRLYRWTPGSLPPEDFPQPVAFEVQQSALVLAGGPTNLTHKVAGGKKPYEFTLLKSLPGMTVEPLSGTVTIDSAELMPRIESQMVEHARDLLAPTEETNLAARLSEYSSQTVDRFKRLVGRAPVGLPFAVPVQLRVTDADGQSDDLTYFVFAEIPEKPLMEKVERRTAELLAKSAKPGLREAVINPGASGKAASEYDSLRGKVESLEARVDLMTRELSRLIRALESKETPKEK